MEPPVLWKLSLCSSKMRSGKGSLRRRLEEGRRQSKIRSNENSSHAPSLSNAKLLWWSCYIPWWHVFPVIRSLNVRTIFGRLSSIVPPQLRTMNNWHHFLFAYLIPSKTHSPLVVIEEIVLCHVYCCSTCWRSPDYIRYRRCLSQFPVESPILQKMPQEI